MKKFLIALVVSGFLVPAYSEGAAKGTEANTEEGLEYLLFEEVPVVVSSSFFKTDATKAPGYTRVINLQEIEMSPARNLADLLNYYVMGIDMSTHASHGPIVGVRGIKIDNNAKTLVMLDGEGINHRMHFGFMNEYALPLIGDIKAVEVINGPGAITNGSGAISGFINMIPKNGKDNAGSFVNAEYGFQEKSQKVEAGYGTSFSDTNNLYVYAGVVQADGTKVKDVWDWNHHSDDPRDNPLRLSYGLKAQAFPEPSYKVASYWNDGNFNLNVFAMETNSSFNSPWRGGTLAVTDFTSYTETFNSGIRPKYTVNFDDTTSLDIVGAFEFLDFYQNYDDLGLNDRTSAMGAKEDHQELKLVAKTTRFAKNSLALGGLFGFREFTNGDTWLHGTYPTSDQMSAGKWKEAGLFGEDIIQITDPWTLSLGLRYDKVYYSTFKSEPYVISYFGNRPIENTPPDTANTSPRIATSYAFSDSTVAKVSYQEGFRYPDSFAYVWVAGWNGFLRQGGYPLLKTPEPEKMKSTEFNINQKFKEIKLELNVSLYYNTYENTLSWHDFGSDWNNNRTSSLPSSAIDYILHTNPGHWWMGAITNSEGKFSSEGVEVLLSYYQFSTTTLMLGYGYSRPVGVSDSAAVNLSGLFTSDQSDWNQYPTQEVKFMTLSKFMDNKLDVSLSYIYKNAMDERVAPYDDAYSTVDASVGYNFTENFSAKLNAHNLFGSKIPPLADSNNAYQGSAGLEQTYVYLSAKYKM